MFKYISNSSFYFSFNKILKNRKSINIIENIINSTIYSIINASNKSRIVINISKYILNTITN